MLRYDGGMVVRPAVFVNGLTAGLSASTGARKMARNQTLPAGDRKLLGLLEARGRAVCAGAGELPPFQPS